MLLSTRESNAYKQYIRNHYFLPFFRFAPEGPGFYRGEGVKRLVIGRKLAHAKT